MPKNSRRATRILIKRVRLGNDRRPQHLHGNESLTISSTDPLFDQYFLRRCNICMFVFTQVGLYLIGSHLKAYFGKQQQTYIF